MIQHQREGWVEEVALKPVRSSSHSHPCFTDGSTKNVNNLLSHSC